MRSRRGLRRWKRWRIETNRIRRDINMLGPRGFGQKVRAMQKRATPAIFDRQGREIDLSRRMAMEIARRGKQLPRYQRVALDVIGDVEVSTVWIGYEMVGGLFDRITWPPCIFETICFAKDTRIEVRSLPGGRYTGEAAARAGHASIVEWLKQGRPWDATSCAQCGKPFSDDVPRTVGSAMCQTCERAFIMSRIFDDGPELQEVSS